MSNPLVSIIIDNFNYERFLPECIESALSQTYPRTEVLVVDDASTDGSRAVIGGFVDRVVAVLSEHNGGQAAAMNAGFLRSRGEIVLFLDADDYLYPGAVERVVSAWSPEISKLQYRLDLIDRAGEKIDLYPSAEIQFDSGDVVPQLLFAGRYETTVTSGNAFSRAALEKVLPIPEPEFRIAADGYLVNTVPFFGPVASLDEALGAYRQHGANGWARGSIDPVKQLRRTLEHDAFRYEVLRRKASSLGLKLSLSPGLNDHAHLETRISSLCMEPDQHIHAGDSRLELGLRGALSCRKARLPWKRRAIQATWFLAVGILPRPVAATAVAWRIMPDSRPPSVDRMLKTIRWIARDTPLRDHARALPLEGLRVTSCAGLRPGDVERHSSTNCSRRAKRGRAQVAPHR
jgi:hypothetical protein